MLIIITQYISIQKDQVLALLNLLQFLCKFFEKISPQIFEIQIFQKQQHKNLANGSLKTSFQRLSKKLEHIFCINCPTLAKLMQNFPV